MNLYKKISKLLRNKNKPKIVFGKNEGNIDNDDIVVKFGFDKNNTDSISTKENKPAKKNTLFFIKSKNNILK